MQSTGSGMSASRSVCRRVRRLPSRMRSPMRVTTPAMSVRVGRGGRRRPSCRSSSRAAPAGARSTPRTSGAAVVTSARRRPLRASRELAQRAARRTAAPSRGGRSTMRRTAWRVVALAPMRSISSADDRLLGGVRDERVLDGVAELGARLPCRGDARTSRRRSRRAVRARRRARGAARAYRRATIETLMTGSRRLARAPAGTSAALLSVRP